MPKLPVLRAGEVIRTLDKDGWVQTKSKGGHRQLRHPHKPGRITIPVHGGKDVEPWLLHHIIRQAGLTVEEFLKLL